MKYTQLFLYILCLSFIACNNEKTDAEGTTEKVKKINDETSDRIDKEKDNIENDRTWEQDGIQLSVFKNTKEFPDAKLKYVSGPERKSNSTVEFNFNVENYELAVQTPDADETHCANSEKGQHIHAIIDNKPYTAHYDTKVELKDLKDGMHLGLFFLSRSYHESIKNGKAFYITDFGTGKHQKKSWDLTQPMLFYSRPKGEYDLSKADKILLDFFLLNTELGDEGHQVKLTIDNTTEFLIREWKPYVIKGLKKGKHTFKLELIDKNKQLVPGPANSITREITVK